MNVKIREKRTNQVKKCKQRAIGLIMFVDNTISFFRKNKKIG